MSPITSEKLIGHRSTRPGSLLLTGYWQPVYNQTTQVREAILKSWLASRTVRIRTLAKTFTTLALKTTAHTNKILHELSGYSDTPQDWKPSQGFDFKFIQFESDQNDQVLEADVVIIGSGCGGGVSAKNLAEAGHSVLIVDKAYHFPPTQLPMAQDAGCNYLYDNNGFYITEDSGCNVSAGSAWGGGGTVNWSVCLRLQDSVRKEWADTGLPFFTSPEFDECTDRVWEVQGAGTDQIRHNHRNQVLLNGSKKLGWAARETALNTAGKEHYCGHCHLGCGSAEKRGPAQSWLPDAAQAGAQFIEGFNVEKILFEEDGQTAIGVEGEWTSRDAAGGVSGPDSERVKRRITIRAKKVIMAAGTLWSPMVLMKSGINVSCEIIGPWRYSCGTDRFARTNISGQICISTLATSSQPYTTKRHDRGREESSPASARSLKTSMGSAMASSWRRHVWW